jgi:nucleoside-diphosphate-sugar epimerase
VRVFVTGATGFIGTELVKELIEAGHDVRGMARSDEGITQLKAAGVEAHRGDLTDLDSLVVTSGVGLTSGGPGHVRTESDPAVDSPTIPRRPEKAAQSVAEKGVHVAIVRLPQVHDTRKQGLVPFLTQIAREKGVSVYIGDGSVRWAAAPLKDVAHLYRLVVDKAGPGMTIYNAVQEEGVSLREIAETIGKGLKVPVVSITPEQAAEHFSWFAHFATLDMPASSEWTRKTLGWEPTGPGLIEDLTNMKD